MGIRICPECGGKVSDSRKDCIHCGYVFPVTKQCPDCGGNIEENAKVCPECGYSFEVEQTTEVATANVAPTVQTSESEAKQTSNFDETTSVVCPQCGSNDIELKSSELGKCRSCGTTVVLPKKEQQVNVVNNFVVNNNAENSAQYYTIKRERTLNDEFIRGAYVDLACDRATPVDVAEGNFEDIVEDNEQYIEVNCLSNVNYAAMIGIDYKVTYTDYDSQGKPTQKTKTETEWKAFSGNFSKESVKYRGNDDNSERARAFDLAVNYAEPGSIMPYDGTNSSVAPLPPDPSAVESAKTESLEDAKKAAEKSLPGDRHKDFYASGHSTVTSLKSYVAPTQNAKFKYNDGQYDCTAFSFGPFNLGGYVPDDSDTVHKSIAKKTNPLLIVCLVLAGISLAMTIVACLCPLGYAGSLSTLLVPTLTMFVMIVVTTIIINVMYTKMLRKRQETKIARIDEKLTSLGLAPMTDSEKARATSKSDITALTSKRNPLRIATVIICLIMFFVSLANIGNCTPATCSNCGSYNTRESGDYVFCDDCKGFASIPDVVYCPACNSTQAQVFPSDASIICHNCGYEGTLYTDGNSAVCLHSFDNDCDKDCNDCGFTRETQHMVSTYCDTTCDICGCEVVPYTDHTYDNTCDTTCNECYAIREVEHTYSSDCDTICDVCEYERVSSVNHTYDNSCDTTCDDCGYDREIEHTYSSDCDRICNVCERERVSSVGHVYTNTCDTSCNDCGAIREIEHTYSSDCDTICNVCEHERVSSISHTYDNTCDTNCNECGAVREIEHTYTSECDTICDICGSTRMAEEHTYVSDCDVNCEECGFERTVLTSHTFDDNCDEDCNLCGATRTIEHTYSSDCDIICNVCEHERVSSISHTYDNTCDTTCNDCGVIREIEHTYSSDCDIICNICEHERVSSVNHTYDNTCDTTCNDCGAVREIEHTYSSDCDIICNVCEHERVPSVNHTYDNTCDTTCNNCGAIRETEHTYSSDCDTICNVCEDERTALVDHTAYDNTCDTTCNECGAIREIEHTYSSDCDRICNVCGATRTTSTAHTDARPADNSCDNCGASVSTLTFTLSGDGQSYAITDANSSISGDITLPSTYNGKPVTTIGYEAFYNCTGLTSVTIGDSVTTIGGAAFENCSSLTNVTFGENSQLTAIGGYAFRYCDSLTSIVIPDSVTTIGREAFYKCTSLTSVTFGANSQLTTIGSFAFMYCTSLTSLVIPDSVTTIGESAFANCNSLTDVYYTGTEEQWKAISTGSFNTKLINVTKHYYSETQPTTEGNYWYYDENGNPVDW